MSDTFLDYTKQLETMYEWDQGFNTGNFVVVAYEKSDDKKPLWIGQTNYKNLYLDMIEYGVRNAHTLQLFNENTTTHEMEYCLTGEFSIGDMSTLLYNYDAEYSSEEKMLKDYFPKGSSIWKNLDSYEQLMKEIYKFGAGETIEVYTIASNDKDLLSEIWTELNSEMIDQVYINDSDSETIYFVEKEGSQFIYRY